MRLASAFAAAAILLAGGASFTDRAFAHDESKSIPVILSPTNGATVASPVTVIYGLKDAPGAKGEDGDKPAAGGAMEKMSGMGNMSSNQMSGDEHHHHGHLHLFIDSPLSKVGSIVPVDDKHVHLMGSEPKTVLNLAPGRHTLQLIMGGEDHMIRAHAPRSKKITIIVK